MKKSGILVALFLITVCMLLLSGFGSSVREGKESDETAVETSDHQEDEVKVEPVEKISLKEGNLLENKAVYSNDKEDSVITMYLTVSKGNESDGSDHTWSEVNSYSSYDYQNMGVDRYKVEGLLQIDETGDGVGKASFGYGETSPNVSVQVRGQTSSRRRQKNYKVRIKDGKGEFRNQRTLDLNKHEGAPYRFENKLAYDLLKTVPQLVGGRTQFVHLYVKDETEDGDEEFRDYGLYTMVEQVNRTFLKNHGIDENGQLYKVTFFEWNKFDELMIEKDDPEFDQEAFDQYLEEKGDKDLSKLHEVIEDVQNYSKPIEKVVEEHFDPENICYWMAFNLLIGNVDVGARNLFLYSPLNSGKFYMICWDMDASFHNSSNRANGQHYGESWECGMSRFLGLTLVNRMMKVKKYRDMLDAAIEDIYRNYVTPETVSERVSVYKEIVKPYLFSQPDYELRKIHEVNEYDELAACLDDEVTENYEAFKISMKNPWPFFIDKPVIDKGQKKTILSWGISYDFNGEEVSYDYLIAKDPDFEDVILEGHDLRIPTSTTEILDPGTYFLRIRATNESGYTMDCFDYYAMRGRGKIYGCYCFRVENNGSVTVIEEEPKVAK